MIGLNAGWLVTSLTCSPSIHTSRPSARDCRYSSPVLITVLPSHCWCRVRCAGRVRMELGDLAPEGHHVVARQAGAELFRVAAARPDRGGDGAWGPRVADRADRGEVAPLLALGQLPEQVLVRQPGGHHDDAVCGGLTQLAGVGAGQRYLAGADRGER